jgi:hypothetical protein
MRNNYLTLLVTGSLLASSAYGATNTACDNQLMASLRACERIVGSLHPDKPGQMRVLASDGSAFTAGQVQWMNSQLRLIAKACAGNNAADASRRLAEVRQLLNEHHHEA